MGRPPSNGGPSFRFSQPEIAEMEAILQAHNVAMPEGQVLVSLAEKFSETEERKGKMEVQMKQVWNWFQNRRYAIRAKTTKSPTKLNVTQMPQDDSATVKGVPQPTQPLAAASSAAVRSLPQAPQQPTVPSASVRTFPQAPQYPPQHPPAFSAPSAGRLADNSQMEYEAKSARDGAWYDVATFLSHRSLDTGDPEVMVRFAGFGAEEDEWVNIRKNVRQRSLPCESSECVAVLPSDLILCFQEGKEQALYFDAHVLDAQRRCHDVRGCRCRFLVRYDHDQSEEIVALRKICRRPETDYRLQQLQAVNNESISANPNKNGANNNPASTLRVYPPAEAQPKQHKVEPVAQPSPAEAPQKRQRLDSTGQSEGSQMQVKVESAVLAPPAGFVPRDQRKVQPAVPDPASAPVAQPLVEPQKVDPVVPSTTQDSAESKNVEAIGPTHADQVQSMMPDSSSEVVVEPHKAEPAPSGELSREPKTVEPAVPQSTEVSPKIVVPSVEIPQEAPVESRQEKPEVAEAPKEPVVSSSSVKVPTELHEAEPATKTEEPVVPVSTNEPNVAQESLETKAEESMVSASPDDPNAVPDAVETKTQEPILPVSTDDPNMVQESVETKTEEPMVPVSADDSKVVHEATKTKTEEPEAPVSTNVDEEALETKTDEPMVPVSTTVVEESTETVTKKPMGPTNDLMVIEAEEEQAKVSENMESNKDTHTKVADIVSDNTGESSVNAPENAAVAMEEEYWWTYMRTDAEGLDDIRRLTEAGKLKVPVEKTFPVTKFARHVMLKIRG